MYRLPSPLTIPTREMLTLLPRLTGRVLEEVRTQHDGIIFFSHHRPLVLQNALLYRIAVR